MSHSERVAQIYVVTHGMS